MASIQENLVPSPTKKATLSCCKAIILTLSLVSLISLATFINIQVPIINNSSDLCKQSPNPVSCHTVVSGAIAAAHSVESHPVRILRTVIRHSLVQLDATVASATKIRRQSNDLKQKSALSDCITLLDLSRNRLLDSDSAVASGAHADVRTWLSAVLTNHVTCLDGAPQMGRHLDSLMASASASLALLNAIPHRGYDITETVKKFPSWVTVKDRKLLEASMADGIEANVTVAVDGSGDYGTVQLAVNNAPSKSTSRYVIYVKAGTYSENVLVPKDKKNLTIIGDGMNSTIITGSRNVVDNSTTFNSATLAAVGDGFILQDICIQNTAGPAKHQAVALRVGADRSVINRCKIAAYQDTLYAHSLRQFYRDSLISGTVDFIFGNAAVVIQNCNLTARLPMSNQQNLVTAQGRTDPNQNTGTSIQNCRVVPSSDLLPVEASIPTYLGRPWKNFSRTVYMQSYLDSHISPKGWLEWDGDFALDTLYYGEFANVGPGAGLAGRVNWTGYHVITDRNVAEGFTVGEFIQGGFWLQSTGVDYTEGLL